MHTPNAEGDDELAERQLQVLVEQGDKLRLQIVLAASRIRTAGSHALAVMLPRMVLPRCRWLCGDMWLPLSCGRTLRPGSASSASTEKGGHGPCSVSCCCARASRSANSASISVTRRRRSGMAFLQAMAPRFIWPA